jgi:hypothetical protein
VSKHAALCIENLGATASSREKPLEGELKARPRPQPSTSLLRLLATAQDAGSRLDTLALAVSASVGAGLFCAWTGVKPRAGCSRSRHGCIGSTTRSAPCPGPSRGKAWGCRSDARCVAPDKSRPSAIQPFSGLSSSTNDASASDVRAASSDSLRGITWPGRENGWPELRTGVALQGGQALAFDLPDTGNRKERSLAGNVSGR